MTKKIFDPSTDDEVAKRRYTYGEDRNCLSWWFPRIQGAGLPVPETRIMWTECRLIGLCEGKTPIGFDGFWAAIDQAASEVGGYPVFLRTGQTSAKHSWEQTCYLPSKEAIPSHVGRIVEFSECCDMLGLPHHVWAVRKLLPTVPMFRCTAYGNMPVVRELRVFVEDASTKYWVPYWPDEAIEQGKPDRPEWREYFRERCQFTDQEIDAARWMAAMAGAACGGRWSVDVLDVGGKFYVTDMARAERSWGYDESRF